MSLLQSISHQRSISYLRKNRFSESRRGDVELVEVLPAERAGSDHVGVGEVDLARDLLRRRIDLDHLSRELE